MNHHHQRQNLVCIQSRWCVYGGTGKESSIYEVPKLNSHKHCSQWDQLQATSFENCLQLVSRKRTSFHQENIRPHVSLMTRQKLLQFGWEVLIHCLDSLDISPLYSIYFGLYKIPVMEKISISWKTVKSTCNHSLFKEVKSFGKMGLWSFLENSRLYWNNTLITVFNEVLGENEKCMFLFKYHMNILANPI